MKAKKIFLSAVLFFSLCLGATAQTNTFYFMDEVPTRNQMNPAFMPNCGGYLNFIFPSFYFEGGTNALAIKDLLYNNNTKLVTPFSPNEGVDKLYKRFPKSTNIGANIGYNILSFGWRAREKNYYSFSVGLKADAGVYLPRDLFKFALYGTPNEFDNNIFNLKTLGVDAKVYGEVGFGYTRQISKKWNFGFNLKGLGGVAGVYTDVKNLSLNANKDQWNLDAQADAYLMTPKLAYWNAQDTTMGFNGLSNNWKDYFQGFGGALDLGFTYEPVKNLVISAAIIDLGLIHWNKPDDIVHLSTNGSFYFDGVEYDPTKDFDINAVLDSLGNAIANAIDYQGEQGGRKINQWLTTKFNVGIEYGVLDNKISFGAMSNTRVSQWSRISEEVTLAVNFRPADWFKTYFSYSFMNGRGSNMGLGISFRMGPVNTYLVADYIPLHWAKVGNLKDADGNDMLGKNDIPLPYGLQKVNLQMGLTFNFNRNSSDKDRDGIRNRKDKCKDTDIDYLMSLCPDVKRKDFVYKKNNSEKGELRGCTMDEDKDGIPDCYDRCPQTPAGVPVDEFGCPFDEDGDGVYDYLDQCPNTPEGVAVDENGCPLDEDGDGVPDYLDKCPKTPAGVEVDENGCPLDEDSDGVPDYLDKCPNTPAGVEVDKDGCPLDEDGDGVPDYLDKCPHTPAGAVVDKDGCTPDTDGDGVPDYLDKCPNTPEAAYGYIDANGCPKDTDGDGIPDYLDRCPEVKGVAENYGCPEIKKEILKVFKQALHGVQFETGKANIKKSSNAILNSIVKIMNENPDFNLDIAGHTDDVGADDYNLDLSKRRAASVKAYLVKAGVAEERMQAEGYGETRPVATNKTAAGRTENRRVEFTVIFERLIPQE